MFIHNYILYGVSDTLIAFGIRYAQNSPKANACTSLYLLNAFSVLKQIH
jgi:hypothetical protein